MPIMRTAIVRKGKVEEVIIHGPQWDAPKGVTLVQSDTANIGDLFDGSVFTPPVISHSKEQLSRKAKSHRTVVSSQGIDVDIAMPGNDPILVNIDTSPPRLIELQALVHIAEQDPKFVATWVTDGGDVLALDTRQLLKVRDAAFKHVAHTHELLGKMLKAIDTGHVASMREVYKPESATAVALPSWRK